MLDEAVEYVKGLQHQVKVWHWKIQCIWQQRDHMFHNQREKPCITSHRKWFVFLTKYLWQKARDSNMNTLINFSIIFCFNIRIFFILTINVVHSSWFRNWQKLKQNVVALTAIPGKISNFLFFLQNLFVPLFHHNCCLEKCCMVEERIKHKTKSTWCKEIKIIMLY